MNNKIRLLAVFSIVLLTAGCSKHRHDPEKMKESKSEIFYLPGADDPKEIKDPLEPMNRVLFKGNDFLDKVFLKPLAVMYRDLLPKPVQKSTNAVLKNVREPVTFVNDVLQFNFKRAGTTLKRFSANTIFGVLGAFNAAERFGIPYHKEDFGQTFAVWGIPSGPYLFLPLLGPSTFRGTAGLAVGTLVDPINLTTRHGDIGYSIALPRAIADAVDTRTEFLRFSDTLEKESLDYYAAIRGLYWEKRRMQISNSSGVAEVVDEDDDDDLGGSEEGFDF